MGSVTTDDGVRLEYTEHGPASGRPVVLLAGFKAPATSWRYQVPALVTAGYRVVAVDLRGHGASDRPGSGVDMARRGLDVDEVLRALDLRDAVLVGGSMGGNTIWSYVSRFGTDRIAAIAIVDQTPKMRNTADWPYGFYDYDESNAETFFAAGPPSTSRGTPMLRKGVRLVRLLRAMGGGGGRGLTPGELALLDDHARADWRPTIAETTVPVLFVAGAESEYWPAEHAAASAALAPQGSSAVIERDGHPANIEQPRAFNAGLTRWLARVGV